MPLLAGGLVCVAVAMAAGLASWLWSAPWLLYIAAAAPFAGVGMVIAFVRATLRDLSLAEERRGRRKSMTDR